METGRSILRCAKTLVGAYFKEGGAGRGGGVWTRGQGESQADTLLRGKGMDGGS